MDIRRTTVGGVTVLHLSGDFWGRDAERELFESMLARLLDDGRHNVVLNLSGAKLISSVGIGMIVSAYKTLSEKNGTIVVAEPSDSMRPVIDVLKWPVECFDSQDEAIASLGGSAGSG